MPAQADGRLSLSDHILLCILLKRNKRPPARLRFWWTMKRTIEVSEWRLIRRRSIQRWGQNFMAELANECGATSQIYQWSGASTPGQGE